MPESHEAIVVADCSMMLEMKRTAKNDTLCAFGDQSMDLLNEECTGTLVEYVETQLIHDESEYLRDACPFTTTTMRALPTCAWV